MNDEQETEEREQVECPGGCGRLAYVGRGLCEECSEGHAPADRLYRVNDDPDTDTTLGAMIEANEGEPLPPRDMARLRALATGERVTVAIPHGPRLTFERRA